MELVERQVLVTGDNKVISGQAGVKMRGNSLDVNAILLLDVRVHRQICGATDDVCVSRRRVFTSLHHERRRAVGEVLACGVKQAPYRPLCLTLIQAVHQNSMQKMGNILVHAVRVQDRLVT